jgi:hypothetical protein
MWLQMRRVAHGLRKLQNGSSGIKISSGNSGALV